MARLSEYGDRIAPRCGDDRAGGQQSQPTVAAQRRSQRTAYVAGGSYAMFQYGSVWDALESQV